MEVMKASYYMSVAHHRGDKTPERITDSYEFELCTKGDGFVVINGKKHYRVPGLLVLAKPGQKRYSIGDFECYYIHFNLEADDQFQKKVALLPDTYRPTDAKRINDIFQIVSGRLFANADNEDYFIKGAVMQLVAEIHEQLYPLGVFYSGKYERYISEISAAKHYIENNYGTKINLNTISEKANLSPNFFRKVFKEIMGVSPHEYLLKIRLKKAKGYLLNTDFPIAEIAAICGFDTQSNLTGTFVKKEGTTPFKYRKSGHKEI